MLACSSDIDGTPELRPISWPFLNRTSVGTELILYFIASSLLWSMKYKIISADQILVLEHGEIVERGSHQELLKLNGRYRQLYDKQYRFEANRFVNPGEELLPNPEDEKPERRVLQ